MPSHEIEIPHSLPLEEVKTRLAGAAPKLEKDYKTTCVWRPDGVLSVSRKGLEARVHIEEKKLRVQVDVSGLAMMALWPAIRTGIADKLGGLLA